MKITKNELKSIIRKNLAEELNETMYYHEDSKFKFEYCDLGDIEFSKSYKKLMNFRDKASKQKYSKDISEIEAKLADITPAMLAATPELEGERESLLKKLESAKKGQAAGLSSIFDKEFMGYTLGGIKTPSFMTNLSFIINAGAYAAMGPAAALYCKTLKNILTVIDAGVDTYTEEYEEKSALSAHSGFERFYTILDRSIGFKTPFRLSLVLNNYFSKYDIDSTSEKALFKLFFLKELIQFLEEPPSATSPETGGGKDMKLNTSEEKEVASNAFELIIKSHPKQGEFQALIRALKSKPERNNITRQIRRYLAGVTATDNYSDYVKDSDFRMRELESYLAENFIEGNTTRKKSGDDVAIEKVNDFKMLIADIQKIGNSIGMA